MNRLSYVLIFSLSLLTAETISNLQSPVTPQLTEEIHRVNSASLIRINIVMKEQIDSNVLYSNVRNMSKSDRRQFVINELKYFALNTQNDIMDQLSTLKNSDKVKDITSLWIANVINCYATHDAIKILSNRLKVTIKSY